MVVGRGGLWLVIMYYFTNIFFEFERASYIHNHGSWSGYDCKFFTGTVTVANRYWQINEIF